MDVIQLDALLSTEYYDDESIDSPSPLGKGRKRPRKNASLDFGAAGQADNMHIPRTAFAMPGIDEFSDDLPTTQPNATVSSNANGSPHKDWSFSYDDWTNRANHRPDTLGYTE